MGGSARVLGCGLAQFAGTGAPAFALSLLPAGYVVYRWHQARPMKVEIDLPSIAYLPKSVDLGIPTPLDIN